MTVEAGVKLKSISDSLICQHIPCARLFSRQARDKKPNIIFFGCGEKGGFSVLNRIPLEPIPVWNFRKVGLRKVER